MFKHERNKKNSPTIDSIVINVYLKTFLFLLINRWFIDGMDKMKLLIDFIDF